MLPIISCIGSHPLHIPGLALSVPHTGIWLHGDRTVRPATGQPPHYDSMSYRSELKQRIDIEKKKYYNDVFYIQSMSNSCVSSHLFGKQHLKLFYLT